MYDEEIRENIIDNLEEKVISIVNTNLALLTQGYLVNKTKGIRLEWSSILIHAFDNINVFSKEQQTEIEHLYNLVMSL